MLNIIDKNVCKTVFNSKNNKELDIVQTIRLISLLHKGAHDNSILFKQYYKNVNLKNYLHKIETNNKNQYVLYSDVLTFIGPQGILPSHYTHRVIEGIIHQDPSLLNILDVFYNHTMQLFANIITKKDLVECSKQSFFSHNTIFAKPIALINNISGATNLPNIDNNTTNLCTINSGMFHIFSRPAALLKKIIANLFDVTIEIQEFIPRKVSMHEEKKSNKGFGIISEISLGSGIIIFQNKIKILISNIDYTKSHHYHLLSIARNKDNILDQIIKLYIPAHILFQIELQHSKKEKFFLTSKISLFKLGINIFI